MNCYHITFKGHYLGGDAIVFADSEEWAKTDLREKAVGHGLHNLEIYQVRQLPTNVAKCYILSDGDY